MEGLQVAMEPKPGIIMSLDLPSEASTSSFSRPKQLIFDRRYGWVFEEWVEPSEQASIGGRGLFSVVPLTVATINMTYQAANGAADLIVYSVKYRSEIAAGVRNRWTAARLLACEQFRERANNVPFLSPRSFPPRHPILGSRFSRVLEDGGKALRTALGNQVYEGTHALQQAFYEGRARADEQLNRLVPDVKGRQKVLAASANLRIQEVSPFPRELVDKLRVFLTKASEHLQQNISVRNGGSGNSIAAQPCQHILDSLHILAAFGSRGLADRNQVESGPQFFSEVLGHGKAFGHEVSRQVKGCFQLVGNVSKDLSGYICQIYQTGKIVSDVSMHINDTLKVQAPKSQEAPASPQRRGLEDSDYDDEVLSRSPLMTMVAAADDEDDLPAQSHISSQSTARVLSRSTASTSKRTKRRHRKSRD